MRWVRTLWRSVRVLYWIGWGCLKGTAPHLRKLAATPPEAEARQRVQDWYRGALQMMGVHVTVHGDVPRQPVLVASNHTSWLDILVLGSVLPVVFLSKAEVRGWPIISRLARAGGTLFIRRGRTGAAYHSIEEIERALRRGQSVLIFPEGTTGSGREIGRYFPPLFTAAIQGGFPVLPVALRYPHSTGVNPLVPYIGNDFLVPSIWRILGSRSIEATVDIGPMLESTGKDRRELSEAAREFTAGIVESSG